MTASTTELDLEGLLVDQDVEPDERYCHLQATRDDAGKRVWSSDRPICGSPRATRCPGRRLTDDYAGEAHCPACGRPYCPVCVAQDRAPDDLARCAPHLATDPNHEGGMTDDRSDHTRQCRRWPR